MADATPVVSREVDDQALPARLRGERLFRILAFGLSLPAA